MSRFYHRPAVLAILLFGLLLAPVVARGQAVLINVNPTERVILPRPIWPCPHPWPPRPPRCRKAPTKSNRWR